MHDGADLDVRNRVPLADLDELFLEFRKSVLDLKNGCIVLEAQESEIAAEEYFPDFWIPLSNSCKSRKFVDSI